MECAALVVCSLSADVAADIPGFKPEMLLPTTKSRELHSQSSSNIDNVNEIRTHMYDRVELRWNRRRKFDEKIARLHLDVTK